MKIGKFRVPIFIVFAAAFFAVALSLLMFTTDLGLLGSGLVAISIFLIMTVLVQIANWFSRGEYGSDSNGFRRLLLGPAKDLPTGDPDVSDEPDPKAQEKLRRKFRIEGMQREDRKIHDREFRMGAFIAIALVLYAVMMKAIFGLSPNEVYYLPWFAIGILWWLIIVIFPRSATYTTFIALVVGRFGMQAFGPQILAFLPQLLFLPVFYLVMMFFMYGSVMLPQLMQQKYYKPGEGNWEVVKNSVRGQPAANAIIDTQMDRIARYIKGETDQKPLRGLLAVGPPGTGKTMKAKEIATTRGFAFVYLDAQGLTGAMMGFDQILVAIARHKTEGLGREFDYVIVFIDEVDALGSRQGMQGQQRSTREPDVWDMWNFAGDLSVDIPQVRARQWDEQQRALAAQQVPQPEGRHNIMMMGGGMGGSGSLFALMTWMSGTDSVPFMEKIRRSLANTIASALGIPVRLLWQDRWILRLPPGKPRPSNVFFFGATNRPWAMDPALTRPQRFDRKVPFVLPDEDGRVDVAKWYLEVMREHYQDDVLRPERIREFARSIHHGSPAEIEQMIREAPDTRATHLANLRRVKKLADEGRFGREAMAGLSENEHRQMEIDRRLWNSFKRDVYDADGNEIAGWDDEKVDWHALTETQSSISFGQTNPMASNETTRRNVSFHELGHALALKAFCSKYVNITHMSVKPRSESLGEVGHVSIDSREQYPQAHLEGLIRTSLASWATEFHFLGQTFPGVSGDLRNATGIATLILGRYGMSSYDCTEEEREYYAQIGANRISEPEVNMYNPQAVALVESVLRNPEKRKDVAVILGMALHDAWLLIRKNQELFLTIIPEFLSIDEYTGNKLIELWSWLDDNLIPLTQMTEEELAARPDRSFAAVNPFRGEVRAEGADIYEKVKAIVEEQSNE